MLAGWTALCLDAPFVCVGWFWLLALGTGARPTGPASITLFTSVWLAYLADRWFDSWRLRRPDQGSHRHRFVHRHRSRLAGLWVLVVILTVVQAVVFLDASTLHRGIVLLAGLLAYFAAIHLGPQKLRAVIPREVATALFLVLGILLFLEPHTIPLALSGALAALFATNCLLIGLWESPSDRVQGFSSIAGSRPGASDWIRILLLCLIAAGFATPIIRADLGPGLAWAAISLSALLLMVLRQRAARWTQDTLRPLADLALMTPWLMIAIGWIRQLI